MDEINEHELSHWVRLATNDDGVLTWLARCPLCHHLVATSLFDHEAAAQLREHLEVC